MFLAANISSEQNGTCKKEAMENISWEAEEISLMLQEQIYLK